MRKCKKQQWRLGSQVLECVCWGHPSVLRSPFLQFQQFWCLMFGEVKIVFMYVNNLIFVFVYAYSLKFWSIVLFKIFLQMKYIHDVPNLFQVKIEYQQNVHGRTPPIPALGHPLTHGFTLISMLKPLSPSLLTNSLPIPSFWLGGILPLAIRQCGLSTGAPEYRSMCRKCLEGLDMRGDPQAGLLLAVVGDHDC